MQNYILKSHLLVYCPSEKVEEALAESHYQNSVD